MTVHDPIQVPKLFPQQTTQNTNKTKQTPKTITGIKVGHGQSDCRQEALHLLPEKNWARTTPHFLPASDKLGSDIIPPTERGSDRCCVEISLRAQTMGSDSWWVRQSGLGQSISSPEKIGVAESEVN